MQRGLAAALTQAAIFGSLILTAAVGFGVASYMLLGDAAQASAAPAGRGTLPAAFASDPNVTRLLDEAARMPSSAGAAGREREAAITTLGAALDPATAISQLRGSVALAVRSAPPLSPQDVTLIVAADAAAPRPASPPSVDRPAAIVYPGADATPELSPGERIEATVSFYYCEQSEGDERPGDGGGFCGAMRDGTIVYPGAAACSYDYLGQLFRIEGDPTERVYRCNDTGNAVLGLHRDIWFQSSDEGWLWAYRVGQRAVIEILP